MDEQWSQLSMKGRFLFVRSEPLSLINDFYVSRISFRALELRK
jgi:hypothetical protein